MAGSSRLDRDSVSDTADEPPVPETEITTCESCPGRVVFLESGNTDGWIATDHVVDAER